MATHARLRQCYVSSQLNDVKWLGTQLGCTLCEWARNSFRLLNPQSTSNNQAVNREDAIETSRSTGAARSRLNFWLSWGNEHPPGMWNFCKCTASSTDNSQSKCWAPEKQGQVAALLDHEDLPSNATKWKCCTTAPQKIKGHLASRAMLCLCARNNHFHQLLFKPHMIKGSG